MGEKACNPAPERHPGKIPRPGSRVSREDTGDLWVFAYGSLIWQPGFAYEESRRARLHGYHRSLCVYSWVYRGTEETPGLVLGLDRGGSCDGVALRVSAAARHDVLAYLHERELVNNVYRPVWTTARTGQGEITVYAFIADRTHAQYAGRLPREQVAHLIRQGHGISGPCVDYVTATLDHLKQAGINDAGLRRVLADVSKLEAKER